MEDIAARAGVGVGTVYRRFASKYALIDELLRLAMDELVAAAERAMARTDGHGLEALLRAFGQSFADHARYANLLLEREPDPGTARAIRQAISELTGRAITAGTIGQGVVLGDIMALISALRGLVQADLAADGNLPPDAWQRFLDIHLAGLRAPDLASGECGYGLIGRFE
jgi:AcrR family transcriptional regulator